MQIIVSLRSFFLSMIIETNVSVIMYPDTALSLGDVEVLCKQSLKLASSKQSLRLKHLPCEVTMTVYQ